MHVRIRPAGPAVTLAQRHVVGRGSMFADIVGLLLAGLVLRGRVVSLQRIFKGLVFLCREEGIGVRGLLSKVREQGWWCMSMRFR